MKNVDSTFNKKDLIEHTMEVNFIRDTEREQKLILLEGRSEI